MWYGWLGFGKGGACICCFGRLGQELSFGLTFYCSSKITARESKTGPLTLSVLIFTNMPFVLTLYEIVKITLWNDSWVAIAIDRSMIVQDRIKLCLILFAFFEPGNILATLPGWLVGVEAHRGKQKSSKHHDIAIVSWNMVSTEAFCSVFLRKANFQATWRNQTLTNASKSRETNL